MGNIKIVHLVFKLDVNQLYFYMFKGSWKVWINVLQCLVYDYPSIYHSNNHWRSRWGTIKRHNYTTNNDKWEVVKLRLKSWVCFQVVSYPNWLYAPFLVQFGLSCFMGFVIWIWNLLLKLTKLQRYIAISENIENWT